LGRVPFIVTEGVSSASRRLRTAVIASSVFVCLILIAGGAYWFGGRT
jgi:hypothetical protein